LASWPGEADLRRRALFSQDALFRLCNPGADMKLSFDELLVGIAPLLMGSPEQNAAFMFNLYDLDGNGTIDAADFSTLLSSVVPSSFIAADLTTFARMRTTLKKRTLNFDDYYAHVRVEGECELRSHVMTLLENGGVDPSEEEDVAP
jgi:hypothetical protein